MINLNFNEKPAAIVRMMDEAGRQEAAYFDSIRKQMRVFKLFIPAGFVFVILDILTNGGLISLALVGYVCWLAALSGWLYVRRKRKSSGAQSATGVKFTLARTVFETIKDDLAPKGACTGWLDLTGAQQPSKRFQERKSTSGMPVGYYRDEWLRMKAQLYDGCLMRLSAVERTKARLGRWKTSRSGRKKWKAGGVVEAREILRLVVVPNPETHQLASPIPVVNPWSNYVLGNYVLQSLQAQNGRLVCEAVSYKPVEAQDLLKIMQYVHAFIQPRQPA